MWTVITRDNYFEPFDLQRIHSAIQKAFDRMDMETQVVADKVTQTVQSDLEEMGQNSSFYFHVEDIQDVVEKALMKHDLYQVAKKYILYREEHNKIRKTFRKPRKNTKVTTPWSEIGYVTYKRTYSRVKEQGQEEFDETIDRILNACQNQLHVNFRPEEYEMARRYFLQLKCSVAGRFLWQLGTQTVDKHGLASLQNCAFVSIDNAIECFTWTFEMLMLGCGVGFSIQREHIQKIPPVLDRDIKIERLDTNDADFIVPDKREGWVRLLHEVLESYFHTGRSFTFSTLLIRSKGTPIKGFGGVASGPQVLCDGINNILKILNRCKGRKLSSIDCLDMVNIIATIVVAGNVRRSALIAIGDADDIPYLQAKRWDLGIPNWRCMSNNSVVCHDIDELPQEFWEGYEGKGEPYGLINLKLSRNVGRLRDGDRYPDPDVMGYNPCLTGDTMILTSEGIMPIRFLIDRQFIAVLDGKEYRSTTEGFWSKGTREIFKIKLENGCEIKATANHKFKTRLGWKEVQQFGDVEYVLLSENTDFTWKNMQRDIEILQNLFDRNSYIIQQPKPLICIRQPHVDRLHWIQRLLFSLGICSHLSEEDQELRISGNSLKTFHQRISYSDFEKGMVLEECLKQPLDSDKFYSKVVSVTPVGQEQVFDCVIPIAHSFSANCMVSHNCGEQSLCNKETCCLSEVFLPNVESLAEFKKILTICYRICKHSLMLPCHLPDTEEIVHRNVRMGIGISGYLQCTEEQKSWLDDGYRYLREYDQYYSDKHGFPYSIKLTTVKPSGTLSLLPGITPGWHPAIYQYFIRRIRMSSDNPLVEICKQHKYHVEYQQNFDGSLDYSTSIVEFPCRYPDHAVLAKSMTALDELETVKRLQTEWSDNAVSCTIYYRLHELPAIQQWLRDNYETSVKSVSFLLHYDHGFKQAPYEEITKERYEELKAHCIPITSCHELVAEDDDSQECPGGHCPMK